MGTAKSHNITRLYHYRDAHLERLTATLRDNRIYCSSPKNFNDPWDCRPYFDPFGIDDPLQRPKWEAYFKKALDKMSDQDRSFFEKVEWYKNPELLKRSIEKTTLRVEKSNQRLYRIFCLTTQPSSHLMWAHYADKHRGIVLEFDATTEKLRFARRVEYLDTFPSMGAEAISDRKVLLDTMLLSKSSEWSYEKEYRLLGRDGTLDPTFSLATQDDFLSLPPGAIIGVIAGCKANFSDIRKITDTYRVPLKLAVQRRNEYHLDIIPDDGRP